MTNITHRTRQELADASVITATGIPLSVSLTREEEIELAEGISQFGTAIRWARADLTLRMISDERSAYEKNDATWTEFVTARREALGELANLFGCSEQTLRQDASTARKWPYELRVDGASFSHHRKLNSYIDNFGYDLCRDCLETVAASSPKPSPERMLEEFLNVVSDRERKEFAWVPRHVEVQRWLSELTGAEVMASDSTVYIESGPGAWLGTATLDRSRPVIDWRYKEVSE